MTRFEVPAHDPATDASSSGSAPLIIDRAPADATIDADVCVIGAGPAGISTALRLASRRGGRIALIETGGVGFEREAQTLARAISTGLPLGPLHEARVFALGGSTWSWGGVCTAPDPIVFEDRPWVGDGWPFPASELDPYLGPAMEMLGVDPASRAATSAAADMAFVVSGLDPERLVPIPVDFSRPTRFGDAYRQALDEDPDIAVYLHATVTRLHADGGRVMRAMGRSRGRPFAVDAREFVLAGGGIEIPRLLLVSGLGGPLVGRYFMEHPRRLERFAIHPGDSPLGRLVGRPARRSPTRLGLSARTQRVDQLLNWHTDLRFGLAGQDSAAWEATRRLFLATRRPWKESPFYQDAGGGRMRLRRRDLITALRRADRAVIGVTGVLTGHPALRRTLESWSSLEQAPDPDNRVTLTDRLDPVGMPIAAVHWTVGESERRTQRTATGILLRELDRLEPGISSRRIDTAGWPEGILGTWHHLGTTRMHDDPVRGVVDRDGRVHGLGNLSIASSSVFPVSASAAPTLTIVQLALRLADRLALEARTPVVVATP